MCSAVAARGPAVPEVTRKCVYNVQVPSKAAELQQYSHRLLDHLAPAEKSGWERVTRLNVKNWPEEVVLRHRDGVKYLKEVLGRADILASLHLVGELRLNSAGQRVWLLFWEADAFLEEQQHVRSKHGADAKVCALQVINTAVLCDAAGPCVHPVMGLMTGLFC